MNWCLRQPERGRDRKDSMEFMTGRKWHYHGMNSNAVRTRSSVLQRFWRDHISDKNGRRGNTPPNALAALAAPKATFSFAMTVMDKVGGWNEEEWVSKFAASMWIYTKAVRCDGHGRPPKDLRQMLRIIMECVSWVCEDFLWEHEWVTEPNVLWKEIDILETLNYDIDASCPLHGRLLWFSAPSSLSRKFANNCTKVAKYRETVNVAIEITFDVPFDGVHTPRMCLLHAVNVLLSNAPDRYWDLEEMAIAYAISRPFGVYTHRDRAC